MKIIEAINRVDSLRPNGYTQAEKIEWLSILDGNIKRNVIDTHEDGQDITFYGYDGTTALDTELLAYAPYTEMYPLWIEAKIDYYNGEFGRYNNSITNFNDILTAYTNDYNRNHMPKGQRIKYF